MLILLNKPFDVLCQFSAQHGRQTLADFVPIKEVYPAGRLDRDSEGLVLLTDDGRLQHHISDPRHKLAKTYWVQVEGEADEQALQQLRNGVMLKDGRTAPATVRLIKEPALWPRKPPVRYRASIPTCWLELSITEGRNRQVRRMTAAVGYPTLRLVRISIGPWSLHELQPGEWQEGQIPADWRKIPAHEMDTPSHRRRHHRAARPLPDGGRKRKQKSRNQPTRRTPGKR